jgi:peptidoglycan/LPS O-acetylase OafA/YrhL
MESRQHLLPHEPALDGMRALAVVAVLLYHGGVSWMPGGFLGVDAFFVLSGFLITSLLLAEWNARGAIDLRSFWSRRCRRLLPAMLVVVAAVSAYEAVLAARDELDELRSDTLATLGYAANWRAIAVGDQYGDLFSVPSPLQHTWSLAIEEQWYLLWPLLLLGLLFAARRHRAIPLAAIGTLVLGSAALMAILYDPADLARSYYGTDTRCQSLLVGAGLAFAARHVRVGKWIPVLAMAALAWLWTTTPLDAGWLYHGGFLLCAALVALVIVAAMRPGPVRSLLSVRPLPEIGLISYGLYLWHWPVYVVLSSSRTNLDGWSLLVLRVCVTGILAVASYVLIERPVRAGTFRLPRPALSVPAVVAGVATIALVATSGGQPSVVFAAPTAPPTTTPADSLGAGGALTPESAKKTSPEPTRVAVVGDSVALVMGEGLMRVGPSFGLEVWDQGLLGCGVLRGTMWIEGAAHEVSPVCSGWPTRFREIVDMWEPQVVVLLIGAWDAYDVKMDGEWVEFGTPRHDAFVLGEIRHAIDVLRSRGAEVVLLTTPYFEPRRDVVDRDRTAFNPARVDHLNGLLRQIDGVSLVDLNRFLDPDGRFTSEAMQVVDARGDGVHFTHEGADLVGSWLAPQLAALAR